MTKKQLSKKESVPNLLKSKDMRTKVIIGAVGIFLIATIYNAVKHEDRYSSTSETVIYTCGENLNCDNGEILEKYTDKPFTGEMHEKLNDGKCIISVQNGKMNGRTRCYFGNGQVYQDFNMKDNKSEGITKIYYENGQLESEINFKDGKLDGVVKGYYEDGTPRHEKIYKDGELQQVVFEPATYICDKEVVCIKGLKTDVVLNGTNEPVTGFIKQYYSDGQLSLSGFVWKGKKHGSFKEYYPDGTLGGESNYRNGIENGEMIIYNRQGEISIKGNAKNGLKDGKQIMQEFDRHGNLKKKTVAIFNMNEFVIRDVYNFENGQLSLKQTQDKNGNGDFEMYYSNGRLQASGPLRNGKITGNVQKYYKDGTPRICEVYLDDEYVKTYQGYAQVCP